jgi:AmiR/NasT family two-component response regulator
MCSSASVSVCDFFDRLEDLSLKVVGNLLQTGSPRLNKGVIVMVEGRILVVEDEHIVVMGIRRMLKSLGHTITGVASSGEEAISKAETTRPDLVLMDIRLKGNLNGIEASKEIMTRLGIPVIYLTACSDRKLLELIWNMGSGCIVKPFDEKDLEKGIDIVLSRCGLEKKDVNKNSRKPQNNSERPRPASGYLPDLESSK